MLFYIFTISKILFQKYKYYFKNIKFYINVSIYSLKHEKRDSPPSNITKNHYSLFVLGLRQILTKGFPMWKLLITTITPAMNSIQNIFTVIDSATTIANASIATDAELARRTIIALQDADIQDKLTAKAKANIIADLGL